MPVSMQHTLNKTVPRGCILPRGKPVRMGGVSASNPAPFSFSFSTVKWGQVFLLILKKYEKIVIDKKIKINKKLK